MFCNGLQNDFGVFGVNLGMFVCCLLFDVCCCLLFVVVCCCLLLRVVVCCCLLLFGVVCWLFVGCCLLVCAADVLSWIVVAF